MKSKSETAISKKVGTGMTFFNGDNDFNELNELTFPMMKRGCIVHNWYQVVKKDFRVICKICEKKLRVSTARLGSLTN